MACRPRLDGGRCVGWRAPAHTLDSSVAGSGGSRSGSKPLPASTRCDGQAILAAPRSHGVLCAAARLVAAAAGDARKPPTKRESRSSTIAISSSNVAAYAVRGGAHTLSNTNYTTLDHDGIYTRNTKSGKSEQPTPWTDSKKSRPRQASTQALTDERNKSHEKSRC